MEVAGVIIAILCALALVGLAPAAIAAEQRGAPHARLCSASLVVATVALVAPFVALALGAARSDTGRFLMGIGVGVAVGLTLSCATLLLTDLRAS